ncbi:MAG TPA: leucine--tRNA ligase [Bradyrhizobium sp.]|nr:leucine--tRNA ligase [Bradyrhizobium sp.]
MPYDPKHIEPKWQQYWEVNGTFAAEIDLAKPKFYVLDMFPYPSGQGLHVGHPEGYTATDIVARYKRMRGFNVLHPMGWDAYGLPAERYAVRTNVHPAVTTKRNIETFRAQVKRLGFSYDWSRELSTTDPEYVRWTQWIFLKLFERGLAYQAEVPVNWCPAQGTVLANEEVKDGKYVETGDPVEKRLMRQWMLKITAYADRLLEDLEELDWPEGIKAMQRDWIGRSEGAEIAFAIDRTDEMLRVFTTRPDTLWGATYCVLAAEHPLVPRIATNDCRAAVMAYIEASARKSEHERSDRAGRKSGVFTGSYAINPANGAKLPLWVADYVLMGYGKGAIMAVPGHDSRDHAFARAFDLPIVRVVTGGGDIQEEAWESDGTIVNSPPLDGLPSAAARTAAIAWLEARGAGYAQVQYRLRDWLFSRQRYWGEPLPILHRTDGSVVALPDDALPLLPPELEDYKPTATGEPPLAREPQWVRTTDPATGAPALRETNTMPQWAGSCWYYLRFLDPHNDRALVDPAKERYWMPVDLYVGGAEHAVLHLLYARFWHKVLYDVGIVSTKEPFRKLFNQGMILAFSYRDAAGKYYEPEKVIEREGHHFAGDMPVIQKIDKMSKSRFNVVNPDDIVEAYGADSLRLYEMFMGPLEMTKPWQTSAVHGMRHFLERAWRLVCDDDGHVSARLVDVAPDPQLLHLQHKTVRAVTDGIESLRFNTSIARLMELVNALTPMEQRPRSVVRSFVLLLAPVAPHLCEELWRVLGHGESLAYAPWPGFDPDLASDDQREYVIQLNGRLRHKIVADADMPADALMALVKSDRQVKELLAGKTIVKEIVVPRRLVNFVVRD